MRHHFSWEEETLFPAVEEATGMRGMGPTAVTRMEHGQMRALLDQMDEAAKRGDLPFGPLQRRGTSPRPTETPTS